MVAIEHGRRWSRSPLSEPQSVRLRLDRVASASMIDIVPQGIRLWDERGSVGRPDRRQSWMVPNGPIKRMNLRDVPDDVAAVLVAAAGGSRQSLSAFVVDRLSEVAQAVRAADCLPPTQSLAGPVSRCKTWWPRCGRCARPRELGSRRRVSPRRVLRGRRPPARSGRRATEGG